MDEALPWPTADQVEYEDDIEVLRYYVEYLPPCRDVEEMAQMRRICDRIRLLRPIGGPRIKLVPVH